MSIQTIDRISELLAELGTGANLVAYRRVRADLNRFAVVVRHRNGTVQIGTADLDRRVALERAGSIRHDRAEIEAALELRQDDELARLDNPPRPGAGGLDWQ